MRQYWTMIIPILVLAAAPSFAWASEGEPADTAKRLAKLEADVKALQSHVNAAPIMQRMLDELKALNARVEAMEKQMQSQAQERIARKPIAGAQTGTVYLENRSLLRATVTVNDTAYVLAPGAAQEIKEFPVGSFVYQVDTDVYGTIRSLVSRTLSPNQTFRIIVHP